MAREVYAWAVKRKVKGIALNQVLLHIASWAGPDGFCKFRSVRDIAEAVRCSERTVQRALDRLEAPVSEGGLGLIRRVSRYHANGAQRANGFMLVGYQPGLGLGDSLSPTGCQVDAGGRGQTVTPDSNKDSGKKDSPLKPPSQGRPRRAMPCDWKVPPVEDLPAWARTMAILWPGDAYAAQGEAFQQKALGHGLRQADWNASWAAHVQQVHEQVMRSANPGGLFAVPAPTVAVPLPLPSPVLAQEREDTHSNQLREALQRDLPSRMWERFFAPSAYLFADPGLKVICPNQSVRDWLETNATVRLRKAGDLVRPGLLWVTFEVEVRTGPSVQSDLRRAD